MDSILLRSLPVPDPQSLVILSWHTPKGDTHGTNRHRNSYADPNGDLSSACSPIPLSNFSERMAMSFRASLDTKARRWTRQPAALFEMKPNDPLALTVAVATMPARRASRIEPMTALRHQPP